MGSEIKFLKANPKLCMGCRNCELACTLRKVMKVNNNPNYEIKTSIRVVQSDDIKTPIHCRHCEDAPCKNICPVEAITDEDGVIYLHDGKCTGCGLCQKACPHGVIRMSNKIKGEGKKKIASKCDMCLDRQRNNENPACYSACPMKALELI